MFKKAQAAMEFLMTYGWAILVVLAAIGALAYFGVLSPDRFLPEKCTLPAGIACLDFKDNGAAIQMSIQNGAGFDMSNVSVTIDGCTGVAIGTIYGNALANGQKDTYDVTCAPGNGKFKGNVNFNYTNQQTGMSHAAEGEIIIKIAR
jgi:uncharacterized protein (UPF0333 family)